MRTRFTTGKTVTLAAGSLAIALLAGVGAAEETSFNISLSGGGAGDADGAGQGVVTIDSETNQISWDLRVSNIAEPTAMHIHEGAAGESGGVVVPLTIERDSQGNLVGLTNASADAVQAILSAASNYYVNIHNAEHRGGAVRGQLSD